jgi:FtsK/SpoIIIE family
MGERPGSLGLLSRAFGAAWGWRLEGGLFFAGIVALRLAARLGGGGDLLFVGSVYLVFWRIRWLRRFVAILLRASVVRRQFARALRLCGVVGPWGTHPIVRRVDVVSAGHRLVVQVPTGHHAGHLLEAATSLAAALRVREVRVVRSPADASLATVTVVRHDPFAATPTLPWPWVGAERTSLWDPVPVGVDEDGRLVTVHLPEHNLLLGGEPGAGKSAALSLFVAAAALDPDVSLTLLDGKQVELAAWVDSAERFVGPDMKEAALALGDLRAEMDTRYEQLLAHRKRKIERDDGLALHVVVVDELAFYLRGGDRAVRNDVTESFRDLVSRGRAAGIVVLAATQKPSHEIVPTWIRDLFGFRMALRCTTPEASDTVLGQGWASQGYSATTVDSGQRGVGFLLHEGGLPVKLRTFYLDDDRVADLARRAGTLRGMW